MTGFCCHLFVEVSCHLQSQWMVKRLALLEFLLWLDTMKNVFQCNNNNNNFKNTNNEHILLITMLTIKILFTINSLKKLFCQNTIYNSFR